MRTVRDSLNERLKDENFKNEYEIIQSEMVITKSLMDMTLVTFELYGYYSVVYGSELADSSAYNNKSVIEPSSVYIVLHNTAARVDGDMNVVDNYEAYKVIALNDVALALEEYGSTGIITYAKVY